MPDELSVIPGAMAALTDQLARPDARPEDLLLPLRALQRLGLGKADLRVHVEVLRALNQKDDDSPTVEENALLALDIIEGTLPFDSLRWDSAETARIFLPRVLTEEMLAAGVDDAFAPSNLLPPREGNWPASTRSALMEVIHSRVVEFITEPQRANFFRVPKAGMTSRPAALLAPEDRLIYEGLAEGISSKLDARLPNGVTWPRSRERKASHKDFSRLPSTWEDDYVVVADIESFYECVDHTLLANLLGAQLGMANAYLHALEAFLDTIMGSPTGLPQGPTASDLFASAYLLNVDHLLARQGWTFVRYADDYLLGTTSVASGRLMIEQLESVLRELGLRLNVSKTKVMRRATYLAGLDRPSQRVALFRERIRGLTETFLRESEDREEVESLLRDIGVEEQLLWDLLYHESTTLDEVIAEVGDRLAPPLVEAYAQYLVQQSEALQSRDLPDDMLATETDLRECLAFLASAKRAVNLQHVDVVLTWFPRLARHVAVYLTAIAPSSQVPVARMLTTRLASQTDTDWVTAWLCYVAEAQPQVVSRRLDQQLHVVARNRGFGMLSRTGAIRALAANGTLDELTWESVYMQASPAIRAEMILSRWADPTKYPNGIEAIESPVPIPRRPEA